MGPGAAHTKPNDGSYDQFDGSARVKPQLRLSNLPQASSAETTPLGVSEAKYTENDPSLPTLHNLNSPYYIELEKSDDYLSFPALPITDAKRQATSLDAAVVDTKAIQLGTDSSDPSQRSGPQAETRIMSVTESKRDSQVRPSNEELEHTMRSRRASLRP